MSQLDFTTIENRVPAGFWRRFAALFIDSILATIILYIPVLIAISIFLLTTSSITEKNPEESIIFILMTIFGYIASISFMIYNRIYRQSKTGQSLGKQFLGLYILDDRYQKMTIKKSIVRAFCSMLSDWSLGIGYIMCAFRKDKQALHDIVSETKVYQLILKKYSIRTIIVNISYALIIVMIIIAVIAVNASLKSSIKAKNEALAKSAETVVLLAKTTMKEEGIELPYRLEDGETTWIDIKSEGKTIEYVYKLDGDSKDYTDFDSYVGDSLSEYVCDSKNIYSYIKSGIEVKYTYLDNKNNVVAQYIITFSDCK